MTEILIAGAAIAVLAPTRELVESSLKAQGGAE